MYFVAFDGIAPRTTAAGVAPCQPVALGLRALDATAVTVEVDSLPPTQYLTLEVLAARFRLGEIAWTFPNRVGRHLAELEKLGLVGYKSGIMPRTFLAWLTDTGRATVLKADYVLPRNRGA